MCVWLPLSSLRVDVSLWSLRCDVHTALPHSQLWSPSRAGTERRGLAQPLLGWREPEGLLRWSRGGGEASLAVSGETSAAVSCEEWRMGWGPLNSYQHIQTKPGGVPQKSWWSPVARPLFPEIGRKAAWAQHRRLFFLRPKGVHISKFHWICIFVHTEACNFTVRKALGRLNLHTSFSSGLHPHGRGVERVLMCYSPVCVPLA